MGFSASLLSHTRTSTKVIIPEAHFHAESISASPVVIGRKTTKLFELLYWTTQRGPTMDEDLLQFRIMLWPKGLRQTY